MPKKSHSNSLRRALQVCVAVGACVPVFGGLAGVIMGPGMVDGHDPATVSMDSHFRYLSGLLVGIGFGFWTTIPSIETKTTLFRALSLIVFIGGLARLYSLLAVGMPEPGMIFGLVMELVITSLLAIWQGAVAAKSLAKHP